MKNKIIGTLGIAAIAVAGIVAWLLFFYEGARAIHPGDHLGACGLLAFSPDGQTLTDGRRLWELPSGWLKRQLKQDRGISSDPCRHSPPALIFSLASRTFSTISATCSSSTKGERMKDFKATIGSP